ncbi:carbamoyltransferase HypF [Candidatus Woesearchaeota archaeon]|nr:carbamoyltransferase HypF [Candidatus Woesearchaeota archaeon]
MGEQFYRFFVKGVVQGVGFRPYIYRKAKDYGLFGSVRNMGNGVEIITNDKEFMDKLSDLPPLARISEFSAEKLGGKQKYSEFTILASTYSEGETELPADLFMCNDCIAELRDKKNRRHNYYFITCTNCGPRFSMIDDYPYDRPFTAMKEFSMCPACKKEYANPDDRRYHAQTIACKDCGPKLMLRERRNGTNGNDGKNGNKIADIGFLHDIGGKSDAETIKKAVGLIKKGEIVAIKGVGGFHICSVCSQEAVGKVRALLHRPHKPFAVMARDIEMIEKYVNISAEEKKLLLSPARPIVVLRKKEKKASERFGSVSELNSVGVMLPYTALHYLLFDFINEPLLMTSYNVPGEPVLLSEHGEVDAKYYLTHEREIINRCDDSVIKVINGKAFFLRRSRGFTPLSILMLSPFNNCEKPPWASRMEQPLPKQPLCKSLANARDVANVAGCGGFSNVHETILALGAEMSNAVCTAKNNKCFLSQYIGTTSKLKTFYFMKQATDNLIRLTRAKPAIIACDLHPGYNSTAFAKELADKHNAKLVQFQHHKAHVASVAAEHGLKNYVGIAMDGLGYGEDGNIWGGEVFDVRNGNEFVRIGSLEEQPQLGGDSATIYPKKMLFGILSKFLPEKELIAMKLFDDKEAKLYLKQLREGFNVLLTTSAGRVLDAAAALLGLCDHRTYDGRPAMILESFADGAEPFDIKLILEKKDGRLILMTTPMFKFLIDNLGKDKTRLAATAQTYVANGMLEIAKSVMKKRKKPIVFSGGVAYNSMISGIMIKEGVLVNKNIPSGDGGICFGQAYLARLSG